MNKTKNLLLVILIFFLCVLTWVFYNAYKKNISTPNKIQTAFNYDASGVTDEFFDGLRDPDSVTRYELDEFDIGVSEKSVYYIDVNDDGAKDRITKTFIETGNAHSYYTYKIELKKGYEYVDITPNNFKTTNGASCDLQQIRFSFSPKFKVTIISRELGETWLTPTMAYRQEFMLDKSGTFTSTPQQKIRSICDVKKLF